MLPTHSKVGEETFPFEMDHLPEFAIKKCEVEQKETPQKKLKALQEVREFLRKNQKTNDIDFHDDFIVQHLRKCKYDAARTCKSIHNSVITRSKNVEEFRSIEDEYFSSKNSIKFIRFLPKRCPDGCAVTLLQFGKWDPNELELMDFKRMAIMCYIQLMRDPMTQINGIKAIFDFEGTSFRHFRYATPLNLFLYYNVAFNCIPGRYKAVHVINESFLLKPVWLVFKQLISAKLWSRVHFHPNVASLLEYFPRSALPVEYGGDLTDLGDKDWIRKANKEHRSNSFGGQPNFY
ncbi:alpha-tocopherol transfer protein-like [Caerostris darwini]|uniref:Alpha-tocopherol transfer protein-like n=1 Tax=Caerostris darwini TaxID=1538125 RepID=A0AAV4X2W6_9ARAC|nr:alpha-tocopherol transfer protein-like [Caerostris darwini]